MALSGLPIPARAAQVPLFRSILADIGDHQSLAANLSTFTSHVANISRMIEICHPPALVLLDEVGTGTDPEEGSALGVAIVVTPALCYAFLPTAAAADPPDDPPGLRSSHSSMRRDDRARSPRRAWSRSIRREYSRLSIASSRCRLT